MIVIGPWFGPRIWPSWTGRLSLTGAGLGPEKKKKKPVSKRIGSGYGKTQPKPDPLPFLHLGLPWPILFLWASLARFIPLGILGLFHFYIPMGFLLNFSGFPNLITISFTLGVCWCLHQPSLLIPFLRHLWPIFTCFSLLTILMGLLLPSLGLP